MAQQINLFTPVLLARDKPFSARTMAIALGVFVLLLAGLCGYGLTAIRTSIDAARQELVARESERARLKQAVEARSAAVGMSQDGIAKARQQLTEELHRRQELLLELERGLMKPDAGHSAQLRLIAQTIPSAVWVTGLNVDEQRWEIRGQTQQPSSLNDWMARLSQSPLLQDRSFSAVRVEKHTLPTGKVGPVANVDPVGLTATRASAPVVVMTPVWDFVIACQLRTPAMPPLPRSRS